MPHAVLEAAETLMPAPGRLLDDPYARFFLRGRTARARCATPVAARVTLRAFDLRYPGVAALVLLRNRWYEEVLAAALADGVGQVVLLGAGYDTTALRHALGPAGLFEVDAAAMQEGKRDAMRRHRLRPAADVTYVAGELGRDPVLTRLTGAGFETSVRSLVVWYGASFFLTEAGIRRSLEDMALLCAPGSLLLWDYLDSSVVDGSTRYVGAQRARIAVARRGRPYTFGLPRKAAPALLAPYGFTVRDHLRLPDLAARHGGPEGIWCSDDDFVGVLTCERRAEQA